MDGSIGWVRSAPLLPLALISSNQRSATIIARRSHRGDNFSLHLQNSISLMPDFVRTGLAGFTRRNRESRRPPANALALGSQRESGQQDFLSWRHFSKR